MRRVVVEHPCHVGREACHYGSLISEIVSCHVIVALVVVTHPNPSLFGCTCRPTFAGKTPPRLLLSSVPNPMPMRSMPYMWLQESAVLFCMTGARDAALGHCSYTMAGMAPTKLGTRLVY